MFILEISALAVAGKIQLKSDEGPYIHIIGGNLSHSVNRQLQMKICVSLLAFSLPIAPLFPLLNISLSVLE